MIRPLRLQERLKFLDSAIEWIRNNPNLIIEPMPNIKNEKREDFISKIYETIPSYEIDLRREPSSSYLRDKGMILATGSLNNCRRLLIDTNIIYRKSCQDLFP